jgi:hypothetical protein
MCPLVFKKEVDVRNVECVSVLDSEATTGSEVM